MTQEIFIALIGVIGMVVSALIGAFAAIYSANIRAKEAGELGKNSVNWAWTGLIATFMGMIGLVCGLLFASSLLQNEGIEILPTHLSDCDGYDWQNCWLYDHNSQTMTWVGVGNGSGDIGQSGEALTYIRSGYDAVFTIESDMEIYICNGEINSQVIVSCPQILSLVPGTYTVKSSLGGSGGFRVYP